MADDMERAREEKKPGTLFLCATPIGNLGDMTYRAVRILGEVPLIAAEDTRRTRQLLTHFGLSTRLVSYHEHNKDEKGPRLIAWLEEGNDLACVSDAGLPGVADPGARLAADAVAAGIRVVPLPGANAALSALIASGLDTVLLCRFFAKDERKTARASFRDFGAGGYADFLRGAPSPRRDDESDP